MWLTKKKKFLLCDIKQETCIIILFSFIGKSLPDSLRIKKNPVKVIILKIQYKKLPESFQKQFRSFSFCCVMWTRKQTVPSGTTEKSVSGVSRESFQTNRLQQLSTAPTSILDFFLKHLESQGLKRESFLLRFVCASKLKPEQRKKGLLYVWKKFRWAVTSLYRTDEKHLGVWETTSSAQIKAKIDDGV